MADAGLENVLRSLAKYAAAESTRLGHHVNLHYFAPALVFSDGPASLAVLHVRPAEESLLLSSCTPACGMPPPHMVGDLSGLAASAFSSSWQQTQALGYMSTG